MIAELILVLAGHPSSLFTSAGTLDPAFEPYLHPGERSSLEYLSRIGLRYNHLKQSIDALSKHSDYLASMCAAIRATLRQYENLVVETERRVLQRDDEVVASGSFVPLATLKAIFSEWDAPMASLHALVKHIQSKDPSQMTPGHLIDLLLQRSASGVARISSIMSDLALAAQRVWRMHLIAYLVHGSLSKRHPFALLKPHRLNMEVMPSCISPETRDSIVYIGRAIMTVQDAGSSARHHLPRASALAHAQLLSEVLPQDGRDFDSVINQLRANVSEWLWTTVLTRRDVDEALDFLANFFLMRNGEFGVALIREIERLKMSRLAPRARSRTPGVSVIREQDLSLALLRASLGTSAQYDPSLPKLKFILPTGPLRPLLPSLEANPDVSVMSVRTTAAESDFTRNLLGTPLELTYALSWPLDLFLTSADLRVYTQLFAYFSAIRHTHHRVMNCWTNLSNSQRARRRWVKVGEGGDQTDKDVRRDLLRCGWGVVREMIWFLDSLWGYICTDVVDTQYQALQLALRRSSSSGAGSAKGRRRSSSVFSARSETNADTEADVDEQSAVDGGRGGTPASRRRSSFGGTSVGGANRPRWSAYGSQADDAGHGHGGGLRTSTTLDFATLRTLHGAYLYALSAGSLLGSAECTATIKAVMELCDVFVATIERWGNDILPGLLEDGSLGSGDDARMLRDRSKVIHDVNETLSNLLDTFYDQLITSLSSQGGLSGNGDTTANASTFYGASSFHLGNVSSAGLSGKAKMASLNRATDSEVRRTVERLLLRLDFNGRFSTAQQAPKVAVGILQEGGLV